jgi:bifunctional ADP-heptose synthase (sugar kinase/adenylyltransferase)
VNALVFGDLMIDLYSVGIVSRQSPEDPTIPVVHVSAYEHYLGGAGVVANWLRAFGDSTWLATLLPPRLCDHESALLNGIGVAPSLVVNRQLPIKSRVIANGRPQFVRLDYEIGRASCRERV